MARTALQQSAFAVWVPSNFRFCAKRNKFPDLYKLFAVFSKRLKGSASGGLDLRWNRNNKKIKIKN